MRRSAGPSITETQVSAGGLVVRSAGDGPEVVLISVGSPARWQLPKGLVDPGETPVQAAVREVREETGIEATTEGLIDRVEYWYQSRRGETRVRYHKFVHFFLMTYVSGDVAGHDHEVHEARWFPVAIASSVLAFGSERSIVVKAMKMAEGHFPHLSEPQSP